MSNHIRPWRRRDKKHLKKHKRPKLSKAHKAALALDRKLRPELHLNDILEQTRPVE